MRKYRVVELGYIFATAYEDIREADEIKAALKKALGYLEDINIKTIRPFRNTPPNGLFIEIDKPEAVHLNLFQVPNDTPVTALTELRVETVYTNAYYGAHSVPSNLAVQFLEDKIAKGALTPPTNTKPEYRVMLADTEQLETDLHTTKVMHEAIYTGTKSAIDTAIGQSVSEVRYLTDIAKAYLHLKESKVFLEVKKANSDLAHKECGIEINQAVENILGKYPEEISYKDRGVRAEEVIKAREEIEKAHYPKLAEAAIEEQEQQQRVTGLEQVLVAAEVSYNDFLLSRQGELDE